MRRAEKNVSIVRYLRMSVEISVVRISSMFVLRRILGCKDRRVGTYFYKIIVPTFR